MSLPWKYINLSELVASVKSDLNIFDDSGLIDEDKVIKVVAECNEKLGLRIYKSRECKILVEDYKAVIPSDLYKIENILATNILNSTNVGNHAIQARQLEFTSEKPCDTSKIITYGKMGCTDSCNNCYWVADRRIAPEIEEKVIYETLIPLQLSNRVHNKCTEYSPCSNHTRDYKVDIEDEIFKFSFKTGEIYLSYLGNLISSDGQIQIPFHPKLNPYYEYAIKEKILEDLYLNSEADVLQKLQYISLKKREAYATAWDFANTREVNEWNKIQKKLRLEYYATWYNMYN